MTSANFSSLLKICKMADASQHQRRSYSRGETCISEPVHSLYIVCNVSSVLSPSCDVTIRPDSHFF
jgi:hypothetical protein